WRRLPAAARRPRRASRHSLRSARRRSRRSSERHSMSQPAQKLDPTTAPFRKVRLGPRDYTIDRKPDRSIYLASPHKLPAYPDKLTERLVHWAKVTQDTPFMADRVDGVWRKS